MKRVVATVTATQLPLSTLGVGNKNPAKVVVQAPTTNTDSIWIKNASDVAVDGSTGGHELPPGSNIILPISSYRDYYFISASGSQNMQLSYLAGA